MPPKCMKDGGPPWGFGDWSKVEAAVMFGWNTPGVSGTGVIQTVPRNGVPLLSGVSLAVTDGGSIGLIGKDSRPCDTLIGPGVS